MVEVDETRLPKTKVVLGDITEFNVDAIVNAAQNSLIRGGGVDGAIHEAAGPKLQEECLTLGGCKTGEAKATKGYGLQARYVIHTVGPVWRQRHLNGDEDELLASCYRRSFAVAEELGLKSISFPAISTGVYGFPKRRAAEIAVAQVKELIRRGPKSLELVLFVCFDQDTFNLYTSLLKDTDPLGKGPTFG